MSNRFSFAGLSDGEVKASLELNGTNALPPPVVETFWEKLWENFQDPLIKILCVALVITTVLAIFGYADWIEGVGIAVAVVLATFIATYSEFRNESNFQEQQAKASKVTSNVFRNNDVKKILIGDIVVGDYVLLELGNAIPADGVLVAGEISVNQMALNGEPEPVVKAIAPEKYHAVDQQNLGDEFLCFRGALVEEGKAVLRVNSVGVETVYGRLYEEMSDPEERQSPLQFKLKKLADQISMYGYVGATFIALAFLFKQFVMDQGYTIDGIVNYAQEWPLVIQDVVNSLILAIIFVVVAVPEGLPMMIAIVLSLNMRKLLKSNVHVRRLLGIETSGSLNVLFTDKTGTLTKGHLCGDLFVTGEENLYKSYTAMPSFIQKLLGFAICASSAAHINPGTPPVIIGGNASERAFLMFLDQATLERNYDVTREAEIIFNSSLKFSAADITVNDKQIDYVPKRVSIVKGAPEKVFKNCNMYFTESGEKKPIDDKIISSLDKQCSHLSKDAVRVIAVAITEERIEKGQKEMPTNLTLIGIMGVLDVIRDESRTALNIARKAGIQAVMITGDRTETAIAVARKVDLVPANLTDDQLIKANRVLTSQKLNGLSDDEVKQILPDLRVISRALPTDKSRLVKIAQSQNLVVGMTGDGVNDAAALKIADVGFSMGSGTEVAKEASDIVILDDNIYSIVNAVLYGRTIFKSIRKFIVFQSTVNFSSSLIVFLGPFMGFDFPLTLIQLLWVNLVMDTLAALAFGGEAAKQSYMSEKPIHRTEAIISPDMWSAIIINGAFIAFMCIVFLVNDSVVELFTRDGMPSKEVFLTAFFAYFIFLTNFNAFNVRTVRVNIFDGLFSNIGFIAVIAAIFIIQIVFTYLGGSVLRTVPLEAQEWFYIIGASVVIIPFDTLRKLIVSPLLPSHIVDNSVQEDGENGVILKED